ncbi:MAG: TIGR03118 family protein [Synechococcales cyanobacterium M58_A2018_015]|nr:TIGR03118 family protein [Synechococcales cyanobacterium M58_A2018_015]
MTQTAYTVTNLVSNNPDNNPQLLDPYVSLGWGIAIRPAGLGGHFWINNSGTGTVTEYVGDVGGVPLYQDDLKVIEVTPTALNPFGVSGPTGQVFNGSNDFVITQKHPNGDITAPSKFIFVATDGGISAWTERKNADGTFDRALESEVVVDKFGESIYYGVAITNFEQDNRLYVVDFGMTPGIEVYDSQFQEISDRFSFTNPFAAEGYVAYNIQNINDSLFVSYAIPSLEIPGDEVLGAGLGRIAEFDLEGNLIATWEDNGLLNAPWGFVKAPDDFGAYGNTLLVSNFGDGTIVAFDPKTRTAIDYLRDETGEPIAIDGLWGLIFGNGASLGESNDLYFAAGNDLGENAGDGVFGKIEVATDVDVPTSGGDQSFFGSEQDDLWVISGDRNIFFAEEGNNTITARGINHSIYAGAGNDIISIGSGIVYAGEGTNFVAASSGASTVYTGSGDDTINVVRGDSQVYAGEGANTIYTGAGDDLIFTGSGDDIIHAGQGKNTIYAGDGNNQVTSGGTDTIYLGKGKNTLVLTAGEGIATVIGFDVDDQIELTGFKSDFTGALTFADLSLVQSGEDTVVKITATDDVLAIFRSTMPELIGGSSFL